MIPLYILGLLIRFGPQHGYQIKKIFEDQLSDFTQIKLPNIYYHLERMEKDGLLAAGVEKNAGRKEKTVYSITDAGRASFYQLLSDFLEFDYQPVFESDAVFYFSSQLARPAVMESLRTHIDHLHDKLSALSRRKTTEMQLLPEDAREMALIIFSHHERHYQAELDWAQEVLTRLETR